MERKIFADFDFTDFWDDSEYALKEYVEGYPTDDLIASMEQELGYRFPDSYIEFMKIHNGGTPKNRCCPTTERTSWAEDHVAIEGFSGIGRIKRYSLCGDSGSRFMIDIWEYPDTGIYICNCPSAGHDMILLDYANCGKDGEPEVVHVDQEDDFKKTFLAKDFETFVRGLVNEGVYDTSEQDLINTLETLRTGQFSGVLQGYFQKDRSVDFDAVLRNLFTELAKEKGYFALHGDPLSYLAYDIQFYLLSINRKINTPEELAREYPKMVAMGNHGITTGGYGPDFVKDWFNKRVEAKDITKGFFGGYKFSDSCKRKLLEQVKKYGTR